MEKIKEIKWRWVDCKTTDSQNDNKGQAGKEDNFSLLEIVLWLVEAKSKTPSTLKGVPDSQSNPSQSFARAFDGGVPHTAHA